MCTFQHHGYCFQRGRISASVQGQNAATGHCSLDDDQLVSRYRLSRHCIIEVCDLLAADLENCTVNTSPWPHARPCESIYNCQWRPYRWCKWWGAPGPTTLGAHQRGPDSNFFKINIKYLQNPVGLPMTSFIKAQRHSLLRTLMTSLIASLHSCCHSVHCLRTI